MSSPFSRLLTLAVVAGGAYWAGQRVAQGLPILPAAPEPEAGIDTDVAYNHLSTLIDQAVENDATDVVIQVRPGNSQVLWKQGEKDLFESRIDTELALEMVGIVKEEVDEVSLGERFGEPGTDLVVTIPPLDDEQPSLDVSLSAAGSTYANLTLRLGAYIQPAG